MLNPRGLDILFAGTNYATDAFISATAAVEHLLLGCRPRPSSEALKWIVEGKGWSRTGRLAGRGFCRCVMYGTDLLTEGSNGHFEARCR